MDQCESTHNASLDVELPLEQLQHGGHADGRAVAQVERLAAGVRHVVERGHYAVNDVVNVGEVALQRQRVAAQNALLQHGAHIS